MLNPSIRISGLLCVIGTVVWSVSSHKEPDNISRESDLDHHSARIISEEHDDPLLEKLNTKDVTGEENMPLNSDASRRKTRGKGSRPDGITPENFPRNSPRFINASERYHTSDKTLRYHSSTDDCSPNLSTISTDICGFVDQLQVVHQLMKKRRMLEDKLNRRGKMKKQISEFFHLFQLFVDKLERENAKLAHLIKHRRERKRRPGKRNKNRASTLGTSSTTAVSPPAEPSSKIEESSPRLLSSPQGQQSNPHPRGKRVASDIYRYFSY